MVITIMDGLGSAMLRYSGKGFLRYYSRMSTNCYTGRWQPYSLIVQGKLSTSGGLVVEPGYSDDPLIAPHEIHDCR